MWLSYYKCTLKMKRITRNAARTLSCNNSWQYIECELRIIVKPKYTKGDCSVRISNWMVIGSCTVRRMYSSDNNYTCKWRESENNEELGGFETTPMSYTEHNGRNYTKGVCSFTKPIPLFQSCFKYTMSVSPGADDYFNETICIDTPYQVKLNHNCPKYVSEGSNIHCECNASRTVSPPALLVWEGMDSSTLLLTNVSRGLNQRQFTCRLEWSPDGSIKETTSYKLNVAYGPSDVLITETTKDESQTTSLICTAIGVYPSADFRWNITCYSRTDYGTSSICFLNFTQKSEILAILCTASNTHFPREYLSHVYVLSPPENNQANTVGPNGGLMGGVAAAVLILLIIVAALIVFFIQRRKGILGKEGRFLGIFSGAGERFHRAPGLLRPCAVIYNPLTQTPIEGQAGPSGDMYTITNTTSSGHVVDDYAAVTKTSLKNTGGIESEGGHQMIQVLEETKRPTAAVKPTTKPKPSTRNEKNVQYLYDASCTSITEVPTDSGLAVDDLVPWTPMSGSTEPDTTVYPHFETRKHCADSF